MARVLLVGDSHVSEGSSREITKLGPRLASAGHEVGYVARGGWDTRAARGELAELPEADFSVLCFGSNDAAPWKQVPVEEYEENYRSLLEMAKGDRIVLGPPPVAEDGPGALSRTNAVLATYSEVAGRAAAETGARFVRLLDVIGSGHHVEDGLHLNDEAYEAIAAVVLPLIA